MNLTFNNKRSSPLRFVSKFDSRQQSTIVQPNSKYLLEDILVRLAINDDVIAKETSFQFFDEETGNQLLIDGKRNLDLSYQLVGENVYRVTKAFDIEESSKAFSTLYIYLQTFSIKPGDLLASQQVHNVVSTNLIWMLWTLDGRFFAERSHTNFSQSRKIDSIAAFVIFFQK